MGPIPEGLDGGTPPPGSRRKKKSCPTLSRAAAYLAGKILAITHKFFEQLLDSGMHERAHSVQIYLDDSPESRANEPFLLADNYEGYTNLIWNYVKSRVMYSYNGPLQTAELPWLAITDYRLIRPM